jgi:hypothetical protein
MVLMMQRSVPFIGRTLLLAAAAVSWSSSVVSAFPNGAPNCLEGLGVTESAHTSRKSIFLFGLPQRRGFILTSAQHTHSTLFSVYITGNAAGNGTVEDGGFQVFIDESALVSGEAVELIANKAYKIELKAAIATANTTASNSTPEASPEFRGYFFRLGRGANSVETPEAFTTDAESSGSSKIVDACVSDGIAGFTHTNNALKTSASATLTFPKTQADTSIPLDVTIVVANCDSTSPLVANVEPCDPTASTYYHSQYIINFELSTDGIPAPTPPTESAPSPSAPAPTATSAAAPTTTTYSSKMSSVLVWMVFLWMTSSSI